MMVEVGSIVGFFYFFRTEFRVIIDYRLKRITGSNIAEAPTVF